MGWKASSGSLRCRILNHIEETFPKECYGEGKSCTRGKGEERGKRREGEMETKRKLIKSKKKRDKRRQKSRDRDRDRVQENNNSNELYYTEQKAMMDEPKNGE